MFMSRLVGFRRKRAKTLQRAVVNEIARVTAKIESMTLSRYAEIEAIEYCNDLQDINVTLLSFLTENIETKRDEKHDKLDK